MKQSTTNNTQRQNVSVPNSPKQRPQNKDDMDSRSGEEQDTKGDDVTHNKRDHQSDRKKVKNED